MNNDLLQLDRAFTEHYKGLYEIQNRLLNQYKEYPFDLSKREINEAIYQRMMAFWHFNVHNAKELLQRSMTTPAADFFTETCLLFFKSYFENRYPVKVRSERNIVKGKNAIRPDLTIWDKDEKKLLVVIELKINDGWKRAEMQKHLLEREEKIRAVNENVFFAVVSFWNFFKENGLASWPEHYVGLFNKAKDNNHESTAFYIEHIMEKIEKHILDMD